MMVSLFFLCLLLFIHGSIKIDGFQTDSRLRKLYWNRHQLNPFFPKSQFSRFSTFNEHVDHFKPVYTRIFNSSELAKNPYLHFYPTTLRPRPTSVPVTAIDEFFRDIQKNLPVHKRTKSNAKRVSLMNRLHRLGNKTMEFAKIPQIRAEGWRFTNIRKIFPKEIVYNESSLENQVKPITPEEAALITPFLQPFIFPDCVQSYIVMLNGKYEPNLSNFSRISSELYIETFSHGTISTNSSLEKLSSEKQPAIVRDLFEKIPDLRVNVYQSYGSDCLTALNLIRMEDYLYLNIPPVINVSTPLQIIYLNYNREIDATKLIPEKKRNSKSIDKQSLVNDLVNHTDSSNTTELSLSSKSECMSFPRLGIYVQKQSNFTLFHSHVTLPSDYLDHPMDYQQLSEADLLHLLHSNRSQTDFPQHFLGGVTRVVTEPNATMMHGIINEALQNLHGYDVLSVNISSNSNYSCYPLHLGGQAYRFNFHGSMDGPNANIVYGGAILGNRGQIFDTHSTMFHNGKRTTSKQNARLLLGERNAATFLGFIRIPGGSKHSKGDQEIRSFLMGNNTRVHMMPFLECTGYELECSHGATCADLDPEELFFMACRGLGTEVARPLLSKLFITKVMEPLFDADEKLRRRMVYKSVSLNPMISDEAIYPAMLTIL